jgi:sugar/nucleoside kinase (ribokinase family)
MSGAPHLGGDSPAAPRTGDVPGGDAPAAPRTGDAPGGRVAPAPSPRVVVLGDLMTDVVAAYDAPLAVGSDTPARISLRPGGSAANVAAWLAYAGVPVALIGRIGTDAAAEVALRGLDGVDLHVVRDPERTTGTCVVLVARGGERTMLPDPGANDALAPDDLPSDLFAAGRVLHVSGYALLRHGSRPAALEALERARDAGMRISLDPASAALLAADPVFMERARPLDLLLPNEEEAAVLGRDLRVPEVVVKRGAAGATWSDGVRTVPARAHPAEVVTDTTGAGDAFAAGFLSAWPGPPEAALAAGLRLAAAAVALTGGRPAYD